MLLPVRSITAVKKVHNHAVTSTGDEGPIQLNSPARLDQDTTPPASFQMLSLIAAAYSSLCGTC
jgi:hypothetical protein